MAEFFAGSYHYSIDPKGRVIIPAKYRERLGEKVAIQRGAGPWLEVQPLGEWYNWLEGYSRLDEYSGDQAMRAKLRRKVQGSQIDNLVDKQGRLLIPQEMREHAHLEREIVIAGSINVIEIWDKARHEEFLRREEEEP
ncbi:MAG: cell division/cell wall cluster transcriptional repressor MraZ [Christensenellaceae bacterium]|jgi:MraZ protein|nr:cell division/cell wall cluster transcriptional repressor MraZ [Christensenellaceae bacterium]